MYYTKEENLINFDFWSGARSHKFNDDELKEIEFSLQEFYHDRPPTETEINDLFWHEERFLCECIGLRYGEYEERFD